MDNTFNIVGVSTQGKQTKFRVANGTDASVRAKVLERNGHTDINLIVLDAPVSKADAIAAFKAQFPEYAALRLPNEKEPKAPKAAVVKTVTIKKVKKGEDVSAQLLAADTAAGESVVDAVAESEPELA